ncbi:hypothetical protein D9M68_602570 [compost metagenome]
MARAHRRELAGRRGPRLRRRLPADARGGQQAVRRGCGAGRAIGGETLDRHLQGLAGGDLLLVGAFAEGRRGRAGRRPDAARGADRTLLRERVADSRQQPADGAGVVGQRQAARQPVVVPGGGQARGGAHGGCAGLARTGAECLAGGSASGIGSPVQRLVGPPGAIGRCGCPGTAEQRGPGGAAPPGRARIGAVRAGPAGQWQDPGRLPARSTPGLACRAPADEEPALGHGASGAPAGCQRQHPPGVAAQRLPGAAQAVVPAAELGRAAGPGRADVWRRRQSFLAGPAMVPVPSPAPPERTFRWLGRDRREGPRHPARAFAGPGGAALERRHAVRRRDDSGMDRPAGRWQPFGTLASAVSGDRRGRRRRRRHPRAGGRGPGPGRQRGCGGRARLAGGAPRRAHRAPALAAAPADGASGRAIRQERPRGALAQGAGHDRAEPVAG